jgi:hypothetical protein
LQLAVLRVLLWLCAAVRHHWVRCRNSVRKPGGHSRMAWTEGGQEMHTLRVLCGWALLCNNTGLASGLNFCTLLLIWHWMQNSLLNSCCRRGGLRNLQHMHAVSKRRQRINLPNICDTELRACWCRPQAPCRKIPSIHWWGRQELKEKYPSPKPF